MTTTFTDNFARPDENPISDGGLYGPDIAGRPDHPVAVVGGVAVSANSGIGNSGSCTLLQPTSSANCKASMKIGNINSYWEVFIRVDATGPFFNGYALVGIPGSNVQVYSAVAGVSTPIFDVGAGSAGGQNWQLRAAGITLYIDVDGVQVGHFDDPTYQSAGLVGWLFGPDPGMYATQFSADPFPDSTLSVPGPPPMVGRMNR